MPKSGAFSIAIDRFPTAERQRALTSEEFWARAERHGDKLYNFAWRLAGNDADAADLVQEALARAFAARDRYDATRPFDAWVGRILHNAFMDNVRRYERRNAVSYDAPLPNGETPLVEKFRGDDPDPADDLLNRERDGWVRRALQALPPVYRAAVTLCDIEGHSYETLAEIMGCPLGTVRSRLHQGRRLLRAFFDRYNAEAAR